MAVAVVDTGTAAYNTSATTQNFTFTISATATAAAVFIAQDATQSITSVTWDPTGANQSLTLIGSEPCPTATNGKIYIYGIVNPTAGASKTLRVINGTATGTSAELQSYSGTNTTSVAACFTNVLIANGNVSTPTNVGTAAQSGANGDMYISGYVTPGAFDVVSNTQIYLIAPAGNDAAGNRVASTGASIALTAHSTAGVSTDWAAVSCDITQAAAAGLSSFGWWRREFEGLPPKPLTLESPPAWGIQKLPTPFPVYNAPHDFNPFPQGRSEPTAKPFALTIPIANPIIYWREHDNVPFAKGRDDPGARGTSLAIPISPPLVPRTSHDLNPYPLGKDEPPRMRWQALPTPPPILLAPQIFNPFPLGKDDAGARGTALTIPTVSPVYNAPHDLNSFALGRSEPPAIAWPKLAIAVLAAEVFNAPHDFNPFAQGKSEPVAWRILSLPTPTPVYNAPHDQNPFAQGRTEPAAWRVQILPTPNPVLNASQIFNPFPPGRTDPPPLAFRPLPTPPTIFNPPHDFNPFALGRSEAPAIGWPKLVIPVLAPNVFNAPAIHTPYLQGRSEPPVLRWLPLIPILIPGIPALCFSSDKAIASSRALDALTASASAKDSTAFRSIASDSPSGQNWSGAGFMARYEIDTNINLEGVFINSLTGIYADPTLVTLFILDPSGSQSSQTWPGGNVIRDSVGHFHFVITPAKSGTWTYKWQGTGVIVATSPDTTFTVNSSALIAG